MFLSGCAPLTMLLNPRPDLGLMLQPGITGSTGELAKALPFWPWAADNACFAQGEKFDAGDWLEWLAAMRRWRATCLFAVAPDVVGDAEATLHRSRPFLPPIRQLGFKSAYVAQDGQERSAPPWGEFDWLFIGGTTDWKLSEPAYALAAEAKQRGKSVHMGRVNSLQRLRACRVSLIDSADGTKVKFGPDQNVPLIYAWLDSLKAQSVMEAVA